MAERVWVVSVSSSRRHTIYPSPMRGLTIIECLDEGCGFTYYRWCSVW
ncbi:hypothetical protein SACS_1773 [Parasaccharibacter apium]|uniref:Uncharacterized protein n=1 Tax=Parasaccharibacter apium TaxID=1510841 RepID=A0A7U7G7E5_9PROT|nr:hypothetical protein SACS_1773 [Parasaccharibacter apium]